MNRTCGCIGCTEDAYAVIIHPKHGERTVCEDDVRGYPIVEVLAADA